MQELNRNRIIYSLNVEDIQSVSLEEIGRELSENEVEAIKEPLAENIGWYDAIREVPHRRKYPSHKFFSKHSIFRVL